MRGLIGTLVTEQMDGVRDVDGLCQPPLGNVGPGLVWAPGPCESVSASLLAGVALGLLVSLTAGRLLDWVPVLWSRRLIYRDASEWASLVA